MAVKHCGNTFGKQRHSPSAPLCNWLQIDHSAWNAATGGTNFVLPHQTYVRKHAAASACLSVALAISCTVHIRLYMICNAPRHLGGARPCTALLPQVSIWFLEFMITAALVFTVMAATDTQRSKLPTGSHLPVCSRLTLAWRQLCSAAPE